MGEVGSPRAPGKEAAWPLAPGVRLPRRTPRVSSPSPWARHPCAARESSAAERSPRPRGRLLGRRPGSGLGAPPTAPRETRRWQPATLPVFPASHPPPLPSPPPRPPRSTPAPPLTLNSSKSAILYHPQAPPPAAATAPPPAAANNAAATTAAAAASSTILHWGPLKTPRPPPPCRRRRTRHVTGAGARPRRARPRPPSPQPSARVFRPRRPSPRGSVLGRWSPPSRGLPAFPHAFRPSRAGRRAALCLRSPAWMPGPVPEALWKLQRYRRAWRREMTEKEWPGTRDWNISGKFLRGPFPRWL